MKSWQRKIVACSLVAMLFIASFSSSIFAINLMENQPVVTYNGTAYTNLKDAVNAISANSEGTIIVDKDFEITATVTVDTGKKVTLQLNEGETNSRTIKRGNNFKGALFSVAGNASLTIGNTTASVDEQSAKLIVDGGAIWDNEENSPVVEGSEQSAANKGTSKNSTLVQIQDGTFTLEKNGVLQNNDTTGRVNAKGRPDPHDGAAVRLENANSNVNVYGTIQNNKVPGGGGGISIDGGKLNTYETAVFKGNYAGGDMFSSPVYSQGGGAISQAGMSGGTTDIKGSLFEKNYSNMNGGALYLASSPQFGKGINIFHGGTFKNNKSKAEGKDMLLGGADLRFEGKYLANDVFLLGTSLKITGQLSGKIETSIYYDITDASKELIASSTDGYQITKEDANVFVSKNPIGTVLLEDGKLYLVKNNLTITEQPKSQRVDINSNHTLSVKAKTSGNTEIAYQWYQSDDKNGSNPKIIDGANTSEYKVNTSKTGLYYYFCEVSAENLGKVNTEVAEIEVYNPNAAAVPEITKQPLSGEYSPNEVINGLEVEVNVADGGELTYQWYKNKAGSTEEFEKIDNATSSSYTPDSLERGDHYFYVEVTNHGPSEKENDPTKVSSDIAYIKISDYVAKIGSKGYLSLKDAVNAAKAGETIQLINDISEAGINVSGKTVAINGNGKMWKRPDNVSTALLSLNNSANVTLDNITVDGGAVWSGSENPILKRGTVNEGKKATQALVRIVGNSTFVLEEGATLQNNENTSGYGDTGGALYIDNAKTNLKGTIQNNKAMYGGAYIAKQNNSSSTLDGAKILGNQSTSSGGALCIDQSSTFTMHDGEIAHNQANGEGGAIWFANGKINLLGGSIRNNQGNYMGAVRGDAGSLTIGSISIKDNVSNGNKDIQVNSGNISIVAQPDIQDYIYLKNGQFVTVKTDLQKANSVFVLPESINAENGGKIAVVDDVKWANNVAKALIVDGYKNYTQEKEIWYGPSVKVEFVKDLPKKMNVMESYTLNLEVLGEVITNKEGINPTYQWYEAIDSQGNEAKLLEGETSATLKIKNITKGTKYYFCELGSSKYYSDPVRSTIVEVSVEDFYPSALAIAKFKKFMDYPIEISSVKTMQKQTATKYFNRGEGIEVVFESDSEHLNGIEYVQINGEKCSVRELEDGKYSAVYSGFANGGNQDITLEKVWVKDGQGLPMLGKTSTQVEIRKLVPSAGSFTYVLPKMGINENPEGKQMKVSVELKDSESSLTNSVIIITDQSGKEIVKDNFTGKTWSKDVTLTANSTYNVRVNADYKLSSDKKDSYTNDTILNKTIAVTNNVVALKDIVDAALYHKTVQGAWEKVDLVDIQNGVPENVNDYYVYIEMQDLQPLYVPVKKFAKEKDGLYAVTNTSNFINYENGEANEYKVKVSYRDKGGVHRVIEDARTLFEEMTKNPNGVFELNCDLDASNVDVSKAAIDVVFKGTLDGNGYRIKNLPTTLFKELNGAHVENLIIENANVKTYQQGQGILASVIQNQSLVKEVYVVDSRLDLPTKVTLGGIVGRLVNSKIEDSAAINLYIKGNTTVGGIAGSISDGASIENSYVTGRISANSVIGGITAWHAGKTIDKSIADVEILSSGGIGQKGGIIGGADNAVPKIENSIALVKGNAYRIAGANVTYNNVYEIKGSGGTTNINSSISTIKETENAYESSFYTDTLHFDSNVWNFALLSVGSLPTLLNDPTAKTMEDYEIEQNENRIPEYEKVRKHADYKKEREIAYSNMSKLMPFADVDLWIENGNKLEANHSLVTKKIKAILPLGSDKNILAGITDQEVDNIKQIRVVYQDDSNENFDVSSKGIMGEMIATYEVASLNLPYQWNQYVRNDDVVKELTDSIYEIANELTWEEIETTTPENDGRIYKDYYNEFFKPILKEKIKSVLLNDNQYLLYLDNDMVKQKVKDKFNSEYLKKWLYAMNYYNKWYHFDFDGVKLDDYLLFVGPAMYAGMSIDTLVNTVFTIDPTGHNGPYGGNTPAPKASLRSGVATLNFYDSVIKPYTKLTLVQFIDKMCKTLTQYEDTNDWIAESFDGLLIEQPVKNRKNVQFRVWDIMKRLSDGYGEYTYQQQKKVILPILSAPQEDMYLISMPTQLLIGSMNRYTLYVNASTKEEGKEAMRKIASELADKMSNFYTTSSNWTQESEAILNRITNIQYDTRFNFPQGKIVDAGNQDAGKTKDPVMKWVFEAVNELNGANGTVAYADGFNVYWIANPILTGNDYEYHTITHETGHNQDGKYFYLGAGRRGGTGAESHADGNIAQQIEANAGSMIFNLSKEVDWTQNITNNFSYKRIDTVDKLNSYYKEMFETGYVLDYLLGQAFLELTPLEQSKIVRQAVLSYENNGTSFSIRYNPVTVEQLEAMHLEDMEDLWENKLTLRIQTSSASAKSGAYGYESFYNVNWYQPHNDNGSPDAYSFKRLGQEMLGVGGYRDGYVNYMSDKSSNDLDALRKATKKQDITWKSYKLGRYEEVKQKLESETNPYFNPAAVKNMFKEAMLTGNSGNVTNAKSTMFGIIKRATGDFTHGSVYENKSVKEINNVQQLIDEITKNPYGHYKVMTDLDFSQINTEDSAYITSNFMGILDGGNHKITNMNLPLFENMKFATVKDLMIDGFSIDKHASAILANNTSHIVIENVVASNLDLRLPLVAKHSDGYFESGLTAVHVKETEISTIDELRKITEDELASQRKYVLANDLDFTNETVSNSNTALIPNVFKGELNGNGFKIKNLKQPLFTNINGAKVNELIIENAKLEESGQGILANQSTNTIIEDVHIRNSEIKRTSGNDTGGFIGNANTTTIKESSLRDVHVDGKSNTGGFIGTGNNVTINQSYGILTMNVNGDITGGIVGKGSGNVRISNGYIDATLTVNTGGGSIGALIGNVGNNAYIDNMLSLAIGKNESNGKQIYGWANYIKLTNSYVLKSNGLVDQGTTSGVTVIEEDAINDNLFVDKLKLSSDIWQLESITKENLPRLKNTDLK